MLMKPSIKEYKPPNCIAKAKLPIHPPSRKIQGLALLPTPVQSIDSSDFVEGTAIKISIKREDMAGFGLSGNKV